MPLPNAAARPLKGLKSCQTYGPTKDMSTLSERNVNAGRAPALFGTKSTTWPTAGNQIRSLDLFDQPALDGLDRDPHALGTAVGGADADLLEIRTEFALGYARHVRADAPALLRLTLAVDDRALDGAATGDGTNSGHGGLGVG